MSPELAKALGLAVCVAVLVICALLSVLALTDTFLDWLGR